MRFIVASDIHLGHRKTHAATMIKGLKKCIFNLAVLKDVDAVFIPGDFIDRELSFSSPEALLINEFMAFILRISQDTNTAIRFLDGTPSHDWGQTEHIIRIKEGLGLKTDVHFYTGFEIVKDPTLDLVIGYVSDEYRATYEVTEKEVEEKLATLGVMPDLFFLHGFFEFQVPKLNIKTYNSANWTKWAKAIYIGHDHNHKAFLNITIPGSFDRCTHGEEGPKGYLVVDKVGDNYVTTFKENPYATKYITFELADKTDEEVYEHVNEILNLQKPLDDDSYFTHGRIKLRLSQKHNLAVAIKEWRKKFDTIGFDIETKKQQEIEVIERNEKILRETNVLNITEANIGGLLTATMEEKSPSCLSDEVLKEIEFLKSEL